MMQALLNVEREIEKFVRTYRLGGTENHLANWTVALSGGVDSTVLLYVLSHLVDEYHAELQAVHVEHGVRESALGDAAFVERICGQWGIPVSVQSVRLHQIEHGQSRGVEADLRRLRYDAIKEIVLKRCEMERRGAERVEPDADEDGRDAFEPTVFLGHHANDQLETILLRLLRGTSLSGLAGIRPIRSWEGVQLARPMLSLPKQALYDYAEEHHIPYAEDETNRSTVYRRNHLRAIVIPELMKLQPNLEQIVAREAQILQSEDEFLENQSRELFRRIAEPVTNGFRLQLDALRDTPLPLQRRIIKIILYYLASADWTFDDVESILELCAHLEPSAQVHLQTNTVARRVYGHLEIVHDVVDSPEAYRQTWDLATEGDRSLLIESPSGTWEFCGSRKRFSSSERTVGPFDAWFPCDFQILIEPVKPGMRMRPLGLNGSKKVQDLFVDKKIPRHLRKDWPCFFFRDELIWIPGVARSESFTLREGEPGWLISGKVTGV